MSQDDLRRVERACAGLAEAGQPITFTAVAARAQIGRATLYRRPELRTTVEEHRTQAREALTLTGLATQLDQLRAGLEAVAATVRRHEQAIRRLSQPSRNQRRSPDQD